MDLEPGYDQPELRKKMNEKDKPLELPKKVTEHESHHIFLSAMYDYLIGHKTKEETAEALAGLCGVKPGDRLK